LGAGDLVGNAAQFPADLILLIYLQGSIKDPFSLRDQKANAAMHTRKRMLITEDVKQSLPSAADLLRFIANKH
jgi:hypothetical protein